MRWGMDAGVTPTGHLIGERGRGKLKALEMLRGHRRPTQMNSQRRRNCLGSACSLAFVLIAQFGSAQTAAPNEWTWVGGTSETSSKILPNNLYAQPAVYGALGSFAPANNPGSRSGASSWTDKAGHLWLFGGGGIDPSGCAGGMNDMWEYDSASDEWAWMGGSKVCGIPAPNIAVYGALGVFASTNTPGERADATSWTDSSGNFWLFGGTGVNASAQQGELNDLWEFSPSKDEWAWMGGSNSFNAPGVCGTLGTAAKANIPGARSNATSWTDQNEHVWLYGGAGFDCSGNEGPLNDVWEFDAATNEWAGVGGSNTAAPVDGQAPVYGTLGVSAAGNTPGTRTGFVTWADAGGNLWLFGGDALIDGANGSSVNANFDDLWEFSVSKNEWAWMGGSSTYNPPQSAVYGTLGTPSTANNPGARYLATSWTDSNGNFWLYGGIGIDATYNVPGYLDDLWELNPTSGVWTWMGGNETQNCLTVTANVVACGWPGVYGSLGSPASANSPGGRYDAVVWTDGIGNFWLFGGSFTSNAGNAYLLNDLWTYQPSTTPSFATAATPVISPAGASFTTAQSIAISDTTPGALIFYTTDGVTAPTASSTQYTGSFSASSSETIQAIAIAPGYANSAIASAQYVINVAPPDFAVAASPAALTVTAGQSATASISVTPANGFSAAVTFSCTGLPAGATCTFAPATVTPTGSAAATTLTIATAANNAALSRRPFRIVPGLALATIVCWAGWRKKRGSVWILLLLMGFGLAGTLTGCGGSSNNGGQPTLATVTIVAGSGTLVHSTKIGLTVE